jgi:gamma-glutamyl:cysteine ligase YbdK (ATP-grasp superfamily)
MGRCLEPLTVGYDWEMAILKETGENIDETDAERLSDEMRIRLPWCQTGTDLELIESRLGCVDSFGELLRKSELFDGELRRAAARRGWSVLRSGARPMERETVGAHVHVGTLRDAATAIGIQNAMARYAPALAALMVNSPVYRRRTGEYKSYRVASFAEFCSMPQTITEPNLWQTSWADDVCAKLAWGSTVELRVCDGVSSTRLMCEAVALVAGLMWHVAESGDELAPSASEYRAILVNRWRAAKHGLQAVFEWGGAEVPVDELLTSMVGLAQDGMSRLGASAGDLRIIRSMLKKRQTQADFQLAVFAKEQHDAHRYTRTVANVQRDPAAFEKYLRRAPALAAAEPGDHSDELLSAIEVETPYPVLIRRTPLSPVQLDSVLREFVEDGRLLESRSDMGVRLYTRADAARRGSQ